MMSRFARMITLALGVLGLLWSPLPSAAADPFEINAIFSQTGTGAFLGKGETDTINVLANLVNRSGGVRGRPIKFVVHDDQSSPQVGLQLLNEIAARKVSAILGPSLTAVCNALLPVVVNGGPVDYCLSPGVRPDSGSYMFAGSFASSDSFVIAAAYFRDRGWNKVAIITPTDATGQDGERSADAVLGSIPGMEIVAREHFNLSDVSVTAQLSRIKASQSQVLIAWGTGAPMGTVLRAMVDSGYDKPVFLGGGNVTYAQMNAWAQIMPKDALFPAAASVARSGLPDGPVKRAVSVFVKAFNDVGIRPDISQATTWDSALLLIEAYRKLGFDATPAQIRDYLAGLRNWAGIQGTFDFVAVPQRGLGASTEYVVHWEPARDDWVAVSKGGGRAL